MQKKPGCLGKPTVHGSLVCLLFAWWFGVGTCFGQGAGDRYQLGRRLERFERAWQQAPKDLRATSTASLEQAVGSFFSLQLSRAAMLLDQAWLQVQGIEGAEQVEHLQSIRWKLDAQATLLDSSEPILRATASPYYESESNQLKSPGPEPIEFELNVWPWDDSPAKVMMAQLSKEPLIRKTVRVVVGEPFEIDFKGLAAGDYVVTGHRLTAPPGQHDWICPSISLVDRLQDRMTRMDRWVQDHRKQANQADGTFLSTARFLAKEIGRGRKGTPFEIDLPWNKLLEDFEQIIATAKENGPTDEAFSRWIQVPGWKWMQLGRGRSTQVVRMEVPSVDPIDSSIKLPVLIALHGAGGSENMFFQTYGAGRLIELARERSWIVVSPRQTMVGFNLDVPDMVQALSEFLPVDTNRVMIVGHSMGAAQAMAQVSRHPESIAMVAALGGGGNVRESDAIRNVPFFVAAGDRDFGKPRAKSLRGQLERIGCQVQYREYPDIEHLVIVQAALDDVFAFFDNGLR